MTKVNFEETFEIYLFTEKLDGEKYSKLSEFLSFLKFNKVNLPYKFSYVAKSGEGLIPDITLNDNILMNFSPNSLTASKENQFQDFLKEKSNIHLNKLYRKILQPNDLPEQSDAQMKKLTSLIKSVIFEGQFIFLEEPEHDLDAESVELFIHVLKEHMSRNKQNVFIFSHNMNLWMPHVNLHAKREKDFSFSTDKIYKNWKWQKEKDIFYNAKKIEKSTNAALTFHIPVKKSDKKTAA